MKRLFLFGALLLLVFETNAQFFRGVGLFVAGNSSMHRYRNFNVKDPNNFDYNAYYVDNHHSHDLQSFGVGLVLEFLRYDNVRWQTEIEYTNKGGLDREFNPYTGEKAGYAPNMYTQIQWNNFLKYFLPPGDKGQPYFMLGGRLEYTMSRAITSYAVVSGTRPTVWFSGDVGIGYERFTWKRFHPFIEFHWNPDIIYQPAVAGSTMRNRTYELRIGIMYRPLRKGIDDCNAPKYHGNYY
jgi:hypothetical protein